MSRACLTCVRASCTGHSSRESCLEPRTPSPTLRLRERTTNEKVELERTTDNEATPSLPRSYTLKPYHTDNAKLSRLNIIIYIQYVLSPVGVALTTADAEPESAAIARRSVSEAMRQTRTRTQLFRT